MEPEFLRTEPLCGTNLAEPEHFRMEPLCGTSRNLVQGALLEEPRAFQAVGKKLLIQGGFVPGARGGATPPKTTSSS